MSTHPHRQSTKDDRGTPLTQALDQSERVKDIVEECADDLSSVNDAFARELSGSETPPQVVTAMEKSGLVEDKVQDASDQLAHVNEALKVEVRERHVLEERLADLTAQSKADRHSSFHDPLTGLPNRALFDDRIEHGLAQAKRHSWTLAVMFVDLDNFKNINDVHGHKAGDTVLQIIADRLRKITRRDDTICRHGGDEFLYLLLEISEEKDAIMIAQKLILAIKEPCVIEAQESRIVVEVFASIGIAFSPKHGDDAQTLIGHADRAMYQAKRSQSGYRVAPSIIESNDLASAVQVKKSS